MGARIFLAVAMLTSAFGRMQSARGQATWSTESSNGFSPRAGHAACVVPASSAGGSIYVMGGYDGKRYLTTLQVFDPTLNTWSTPTTSGTFTPRSELAASVVNNKIYTFGGRKNDSTLNALELFDPSTETWSSPTITGTFTPRHGLTSSVIQGKIYVLGGWDNTGTVLNTIEVFDPATNAWSSPKTTGTFTPRGGLTSSVVNGKIYVMGGEAFDGTPLTTLEVFDPTTNSWSTPTTTGTFTAREGLASAPLNGLIYTFGGYSSSLYLNTVEVFDPVRNEWSKPATTGAFTGREFLTASELPSLSANARIYLIGGLDMNNTLGANEAFAPGPAFVGSLGNDALFKLFPNPTDGIVRVSDLSSGLSDEVKRITVSNILGERIMDIPNSRTSNVTIDLSNCAAGLYFARFELTNSSLGTRSIVTSPILRR